MCIEIIDVLRCVNPHADDWLVAVIERADGRDIRDGRLGCPVCGASYPIVDGIASFDASSDSLHIAGPTRRDPGFEEDLGLRLSALLALHDPRGMAILTGDAALAAFAVSRLTGVHVVAVDASVPHHADIGVSAIRTGAILPFATASARGIVLGTGLASQAVLEQATRILQPGGRLVAPAASDLPAGVRKIACDTTQWVAEREPEPSPLAPLARSREAP
ncbi:MAG: hypothetical protein NVS9B3_14330 [Gemmatimonadaceae bacterium]